MAVVGVLEVAVVLLLVCVCIIAWACARAHTHTHLHLDMGPKPLQPASLLSFLPFLGAQQLARTGPRGRGGAGKEDRSI